MPADRALRSPVARLIATAGSIAFLLSGLWMVVAYVTAFGVVHGPWTPARGWPALVHNTLLLAAFAAHHSLFARARLKAWVAGIVSEDLERPAYVWASSLLFSLMIWRWEPVPGVAWAISGVLSLPLTLVQIAGVVLTGYAATQLGVLRLAGVRQATERPALRDVGLYGFVRHPIYFAWLLMVWPAATMTGSRLLFAVVTTAYLVVAVPLEERSLRRDFGPDYGRYCRAVRWRMLPGVY